MDRLFAPLYASDNELLGVLTVDKPRNGRRPGAWGREALQLYSSQAAIALSNARLRSNMQRALVRLEREQSGAAGQRGKLPPGVRVRAQRHGRRRDGRRPARPADPHQRRPVQAAGPPRLRDAALLLLRHRPPRGHRHAAAHLRRGRPGRAAAGPPRRLATCGSRCATPWSPTPPTGPASCSPTSRTSRSASGTSSSSPTAPATTRSPACPTAPSCAPVSTDGSAHRAGPAITRAAAPGAARTGRRRLAQAPPVRGRRLGTCSRVHGHVRPAPRARGARPRATVAG